MLIKQIALARTVWLVNMQDINPAGLALGPINQALKERYAFLNYPSGPNDFDASKGIIYSSGQFKFEGKWLAVGLSIYNNGLMADTISSTDVADSLLLDLSSWLVETFGTKNLKECITKSVYDSQIYLTSDLNLMDASKKIQLFTELLRNFTANPTEEPWALLFEPDNSSGYSFSFERKANTAFAEKTYFSKAALPTARHIELLGEFEKIFS